MKRKPLQPMTMAQVLGALASMNEGSFQVLRGAVKSSEAFEDDIERVEPIAVQMGMDPKSLQLMLDALGFLYTEIYNPEVQLTTASDSIIQIIETIQNHSSFREFVSENNDDLLSQRLHSILEKNKNVDRSKKSNLARKGFILSGKEFSTYVDLRPILSEDRQSIESLVPIIQFKISPESRNASEKPVVFQVDARNLRKLKEAVDAAVRKLDVIGKNEALHNLIDRH